MGRKSSETLLAGIEAKNMAIITMAQVQALIEIRQGVHRLSEELVKVTSAIHALRTECKNGRSNGVTSTAAGE